MARMIWYNVFMKFRDYLVIIGIIIFDQVSKIIVSNILTLNKSIEIIKDFFYLTLAHNTGAAWSLFSGLQSLFALLAFVIAGYLIYYLYKNKTEGFSKIAILFVIGGAVGNAIDRLIYNYVVDFLDFYIFGYDFPIFNIADSFLTIGMFILIFVVFLSKDKK